MRYAGGVVKHLGLSMYRGAVPALAELIANAWDADAPRVDLTVPFGAAPSGQEIRLRDDGTGMTWEDCKDHYLVVGRDRRAAEQTDRTAKKRSLMTEAARSGAREQKKGSGICRDIAGYGGI